MGDGSAYVPITSEIFDQKPPKYGIKCLRFARIRYAEQYCQTAAKCKYARY